MYLELKSGYSDDGPAFIGWVRFSKTGLTVYYRDLVLRRIRGGGARGNHVDVNTGDEWWISGVKQNREDRHWAGRGEVSIDADAAAAYELLVSP
jgi:hypothetical protein